MSTAGFSSIVAGVDGSSYLTGGGNEFAMQFIFGAEYQVSDKVGITLD